MPPPTATLRVNNVAPKNIVVDPVAAIDEHGIAQLTLQFDDPGALDTHTIEVDWRNGNAETFTLGVGERFFGTTHQYLDDNPSVTPEDVYQVEIRIVDDDGGVGHGVGRHQGSQHTPTTTSVVGAGSGDDS